MAALIAARLMPWEPKGASSNEATPGALKVGQLGPGDYTLRITAEDYAGNAAVKGRDLAITID